MYTSIVNCQWLEPCPATILPMPLKPQPAGGVTTIIDYATQQKGQKLMAAIMARRAEADGKVAIDYGLHAGITDWHLAQTELDAIFAAGISSFKMFMTYKDRGLMSDDVAIFNALEQTWQRGGLVAVHAESSPLLEFLIERYHQQKEQYGAYAHVLSRPDAIEVEAISRAVGWAELSGGCVYIVHMSTGGGAQVVSAARRRGVKVHAETCPQYLLLDDSVFQQPEGHLYATCPQIKSRQNQQQLWQALVNGDIQVLATDSCTFTREQKNRWNRDFTQLPYGLPGVETLLPTMHTAAVVSGKISLNRLVALLASNPAKIYGLYPQKGTLAIGSDADIVVFDATKQVSIDYRHLQTNCDWSPYQGMKLQGYPVLTISRGRIVARDGKFTGTSDHGRFVARSSCRQL